MYMKGRGNAWGTSSNAMVCTRCWHARDLAAMFIVSTASIVSLLTLHCIPLDHCVALDRPSGEPFEAATSGLVSDDQGDRRGKFAVGKGWRRQVLEVILGSIFHIAVEALVSNRSISLLCVCVCVCVCVRAMSHWVVESL